jgi:drug/metabolite transporter (DMT)-like permease
LIIATIPILVLALSIVFLKERLTFIIVVGMVLSIVGVALLITGDAQFQWAFEGSMIGDLLILGAVFAMVIYTVTMKNLANHHSPIDITGMLMCYGALFFTPPFLRELPHIQWSAVHGRSWIALACLALFATIGAFLSFNYALSKLSASRTAIFLNCVPVVTAFGAWIILGERLSLMQFLGGGLVLVAVYLTNFAGKDNHTRAQSQSVISSQLADSEV